MENIKELTNFQKVALSLIIKIKNIGKTKLYIGLFIFDGLYYALHKKTFTDCIYLKSKFSPVPHHKFIKELKELSDINLINIEQNNKKIVYLPKNIFEVDLLNDPKLQKILNNVIEIISNKSSEELSALTNDEILNKLKANTKLEFEDLIKWKIDDYSTAPIKSEIRELTKEDEEELYSILSK